MAKKLKFKPAHKQITKNVAIFQNFITQPVSDIIDNITLGRFPAGTWKYLQCSMVLAIYKSDFR